MAEYSEKLTGKECVFVISNANADKHGLPPAQERAKQVEKLGRRVLITSNSKFIDMAREFSVNCPQGMFFALGIDTITRLNDLKYVGTVEDFDRMIEEFAALGVQFIVHDRHSLTFSDLPTLIRPNLLSRCVNCEGYYDGGESSTDIRNKINQSKV